MELVEVIISYNTPATFSSTLNVSGNTTLNNATTCMSSLNVSGTLTAPVINLNTSASGNNPIVISSTNTMANNCIWFQNDGLKNAYIGICGSAYPGNYANNLFIETPNGAIVLNTNGRTSTSTPNLLIRTDGNIETSGYIWAGGATTGLRINGNDYGNTLYQDAITISGQHTARQSVCQKL